MSRIVVGLGGSALGSAPNEQPQKVKEVAAAVAPLVEAGHNVVLCYGDAPQVGLINLAFDIAHIKTKSPAMPLAECTAMDEGYMGFHLAQEIDNILNGKKPERAPTVTFLTQAVVKEDDPAFSSPDKAIGEYYTKEQAEAYARETGNTYADKGEKGWRRVVPSPMPVDFLEASTIRTLADHHDMIIAAGGGGIPVVRKEHGWKGVPAIIDKDFAAAKLAELLEADMLLILAAAEHAALEETEWTSQEAHEKLDGMKDPGACNKIRAALMFTESGAGRTAVIADVYRALDAVEGRCGTRIS